ncbi:MAG TPA: transketolase C-terminal domain-containing protein [Candidatus Xenobia bacterium]
MTLGAARDVNYLSEAELLQLCTTIRQRDGGLGAGVAELAVALHRVFDIPPDRLAIGDASLLRACTLLKAEYELDADPVGTAVGWAWARDLKGQSHRVVAVDSHAMDRRLGGRAGHPFIVIQVQSLTPHRQPSRRQRAGQPIDGRDLAALVDVLQSAREKEAFQVLEVLVEPSRRRQDPDPVALSGPIPTFKEVLAQRLFELARGGAKFVWIGPHPGPFGREYPERYIEWEGMAEHTVAVAASLAEDGIPVVAVVRASDLPRCGPLLARRIAEPRLPVTLVVDEDEADLEIAALLMLPDLPIMAPADENDLRAMVGSALAAHSPVALACPRGPGVGAPPAHDMPIGTGAERLSNGTDLAILALGRAVYPAILATRKLHGYRLEASVINMRSVRPLDEDLLIRLVDEGIRHFLTVEEGTLVGGLGPAVMDFLHRRGLSSLQVRSLGREPHPLATGLLGPHDADAIVKGVLSFVSTSH